MRQQVASYIAETFPTGCFCPEERLPPDYYIVHQPDNVLFAYALIQDCGEYARHVCNFIRYEKAIQCANRRYKQGLIG